MNSKLCIHEVSIGETPLPEKAKLRCNRVTRCVEHVSANTRRHQLGCGNWYVQCTYVHLSHFNCKGRSEHTISVLYITHTALATARTGTNVPRLTSALGTLLYCFHEYT